MMKTLMLVSVVCATTVSASAVAEAHGRHYWHAGAQHHAYRFAGYHHRHWHHADDNGGMAEALPQPPVTSASSGSAGMASWYRGRTGGLTAAHRSWPFGTRVLVTNRSNGRSVVVRIDDRGPFIRGRIIDLNRPSAVAIGVSGVSPVTIERL